MPTFDVTIAGEINLDLILYGLPEQMPVERELLASGFTMTLGSSSAILAHNLAALGNRVGFVTKVGDDSLGEIATERLASIGVDLGRTVRGPASGVTVILPHGKERHILTYPGTIAALRFEDLDFEYLTSARHFHLSSFFLQRTLSDRVPELFRCMRKAGLTTSLDTNDDPDDLWDGGLEKVLREIDIIFPNEREAMKISRTDNLEDAVSWLSERVETVVVKMGTKGAMAARGEQRFTAPSARVKALDPVGAGDSFNAGFLHQFVRGADLGACLTYGNLCGAFSTTESGGTEAFRAPQALRDFFARHGAPL